MDAHFGKRIRLLRRSHSLTMDKLSELLGISTSYLRSVETGKRRLSLDNFIKLSELFAVSLDYLIFGKEDGTDPLQPNYTGFINILTETERKYLIEIFKAIIPQNLNEGEFVILTNTLKFQVEQIRLLKQLKVNE